MKAAYLILITLVSLSTFSQQQQRGNLFYQNNGNIPVQYIQTYNSNLNSDNINTGNNFSEQQINYSNNTSEVFSQIQQLSNANNQTLSKGSIKGIDLSLKFSSRTASSSSNKKHHKHTFHKKINKFSRNFYGKMTLHKKSKHLVDVCFNWSK
jgi:hypothetical protein